MSLNLLYIKSLKKIIYAPVYLPIIYTPIVYVPVYYFRIYYFIYL